MNEDGPEIEHIKAVFFLILTALLWSTGGLLIKMITWNPMAISGVRSAIAALLLLVLLKNRPSFTWSAAQVSGALAYALTVTLFVIANKLTTAANAIMLQYTAPVYTALLGTWFLKERTTRFDWLIILFVLSGIILFFLDKITFGNALGNLCAVLSGAAFGSLPVFLRMQKNGSPVESVLLGNILAVFISLPFLSGPLPDVSGWFFLLLLGIFQLGLSYYLYTIAVKYLRAIEIVIIPAMEPILNPIWVFLIIGETPGSWAIVGGAIVLTAVMIRALALSMSCRPETVR